jgi:hypothetical protein
MLFVDTWLREKPVDLATGAEFYAVVVPERFGAAALYRLRRFNRLDGAILTHGDRWWFAVPPGSDKQPWPPMARYLSTGSVVTLPSTPPTRTGRGELRWVQQGHPPSGEAFTGPLVLRIVLDVLGEGIS